MRLGTALIAGRATLVAALGDGLAPLPGTLLGVLQGGEAALVECARLVALAARGAPPLPMAPLLAPFIPGKILGVGRNYADHAKEVGGPAPTAPRIFLKPSSSVVGPGAAVRIPAAVSKPDWEAELAVVIGTRAENVAAGEALDHVAGYSVLNDISAREFQFDQPLPMTSFAKGLDGFCPLGPWLTTADEVGEPWDLEVSCALNGAQVQHGRTHDLIFSVPALIAYLSRYMALEPGDVIATGTPAGSGHFRTPPRYLRSGDRLRLEVSRVGVLEHSIA